MLGARVVALRHRHPRGSDGRCRQKKKRGFRTKAEAERAVADEIQKLSTNGYVQRSTMTVERFLVDQWLPSAKQTLRPSTYSSYERNIRLHVLPVIGGVRVQELVATMLNELYRRLAGLADDREPTVAEVDPSRPHHAAQIAVRRHAMGCRRTQRRRTG